MINHIQNLNSLKPKRYYNVIMLSYSDKETILTEFPNIKLSYENIVYKKVYNADMNVAIPEGVK
jgi:hypothetical protein